MLFISVKDPNIQNRMKLFDAEGFFRVGYGN